MSYINQTQSACSLSKLLKLSFISSAMIVMQSCIPVIEKSYLTPEIEGKLVSFTPNNAQIFTPIAQAKIYNQLFPDSPVYTDQEGHFLLPANTKIAAKLLMAGHSNTYYPVVIEKDSLNYKIFAVATSSMQYLETVNLGAIIIEPNQANSSNAVDLAMKSSWPCDTKLINNLDRAVSLAEKLSLLATGKATLFANNYRDNHYEQTMNLLSVAENSCQWQEISDEKQFRQLQETKEYFEKTFQVLKSSKQDTVKPS